MGRLITWYAVGVGAATVPVLILTQRMARRTVVTATLFTLAASLGLSAVAPNLTVVALARLLGAAAHGGVFTVVPIAAASLAPRHAASKFVAQAFLGASVGVVAGPPAVAFLSQHLGWRATSATVAAVAFLIGLATWRVLPRLEAPTNDGQRLHFRLPHSMRRPFITLCSVTALIVTAHNAAYAFIAPILEHHGVHGTGYALTLLAYGVAGALVTAYASRHLDADPQRITLTALTVMTLSLVALALLPGSGTGVLAAVVWGGSFGVLPVAMQTRVLDVTPGFQDAATGLYVIAFQLGISVGAFLGSVLIVHLSATSLPLIAAAVTLCAIPAMMLGMQPSTIKS